MRLSPKPSAKYFQGVLHFAFHRSLADTETRGDILVAHVLRCSQEKDLPAAWREIHECPLDDIDALVEIDDVLGTRVLADKIDSLRVDRDTARAPAAEAIASEVRRHAKDVGPDSAGGAIQVAGRQQPNVGLLNRVVDVLGTQQQVPEITRERRPMALEELLHELGAVIHCLARRPSTTLHRLGDTIENQ